jgi:ribosome-associated protein
MLLQPDEIARLVTEVASDKQALDIVVLDVRNTCSFADYFVVCSGDSERQLNAIWDDILETLKMRGVLPLHKEGPTGSGWLLADFGAVVVHIFAPAEREYYQLEQLWKDAVPVLRIQ